MAQIKDFVVKQGLVAEGTEVSNSTSTGALRVGGGAGIGGNLNVGGYIKRQGNVTSDTHSLGAQLSLRDATFVDSLVTGRTAWGIVNYFGSSVLDTVTVGATYTNATSVYIKGAPTAGPNLTIEKAWALYATTGSFYIGESKGSTSSANDQALQVAGGISFGNGLYGTGGGNLYGPFFLNNSEILTRATQNIGLVEFPDGILISTSTNAYSTSTGALQLSNGGGAGIAGNVYVGGYLAVLTTGTFLGTENAVSTSTGALRLAGGLGIGQDLFARNAVFVSGNASTSTIGGNSVQIVNNGGLGVSGSALIQGLVYLENTTNSTAVDKGALVVRGGVGIEKNLTVDSVDIVDDTASSNPTSGALTVAGGVGIAKNLVIGATDSSTGTTASNALVVAGGAYVGADLTVKGSTVIEGDLLLLGAGTQVTINSTNTYIVDPVIEIGGGPDGTALTVPDVYDKGLLIHYQNASSSTDWRAFIGLENTTERFIFKQDIEPNVGGEDPWGNYYNSGTWSTLEAGSLILRNDLDVAGGASVTGNSTFESTVTYTSDAYSITGIDNNAIQVPDGGIGAKYLYVAESAWINQAEVLTTATINNNIGGVFTNTFQFVNLTQSTGTDSGAVTVSGGVGIGGNLYVGGNEVLYGTLSITNDTQSNNSATGALTVAGGVGIGKNLNVGGTFRVTDSTNSTDSNTGAMIIDGGAGIKGDLNVGGLIYVLNTLTVTDLRVIGTTESTATDNGAAVISGGLGVAKTINADRINVQTASINSGTSATSTTTGDLTVVGGVGIGENAWIGGVVRVLSTETSVGTSTGALVVEGGVGIGGDLEVGYAIRRTGTITRNGIGSTGAGLMLSTATYVDLQSVGTVTNVVAIHSMGRPTIVGSLNPTWTDAATLYIDDAPQFSGGADANRKWALLVANGSVRLAGTAANNGTTTTGALQVAGGVGIGGNVTVGGQLKASSVNINDNLLTSPAVIGKNDATPVLLDMYTGGEFTTAKYMVQVTDTGAPNKFHVVELMVTYDGSGADTGVYISQYGLITNTGELGTFDVDYSGGDIMVMFTPNYTPASMNIRAIRMAIIA